LFSAAARSHDSNDQVSGSGNLEQPVTLIEPDGRVKFRQQRGMAIQNPRPDLRPCNPGLLHRHLPGVTVLVYGSRVKGTARPNSDLDLVVFTTPAQRPQVSGLKDALDESNIPFRIDLHVWDEIPERFHEIIRGDYLALS
jgi:predicted nucleotidyltransferase